MRVEDPFFKNFLYVFGVGYLRILRKAQRGVGGLGIRRRRSEPPCQRTLVRRERADRSGQRGNVGWPS